MQRLSIQSVLFVLSFVGIAISIYLTSVHYEHVPLVCTNAGVVDCARVLASQFSVIPGTSIPITVPGLLWFAVSAALAWLIWRRWPIQGILRIGQLAWMIVGLLTVFYLVYVELVRLHSICAWCTGVHVIILVMLLLVVGQWQRAQESSQI
jgi:uncharacterized membrane protein